MASSRGRTRTAWYSEGLRFECARCGRCCGGEPGDVLVDTNEIERMASHLGLTEEEFSDHFLRFTPRGPSLRERADGDCVLLSEPGRGEHRRCTVYEVRPMQCRRWPFWAENLATPRDWKRAAAECPGMDRGQLHSLDEIERLRL